MYGKDREEVADKLITVLSATRQGLPIPNERLTTAAYLDDWLEHTVKPGRKPHTYVRYRQASRVHIVSALGRVPLARLRPADIRRLQARMLAAGHKPASVRAVRTALSAALSQAVKWGLVARNPVLLVDGPRAEDADPVPLAPEQARAFLAAASGHEFEHLFMVMLATGLRIGEALGLQWTAEGGPWWISTVGAWSCAGR